MSVHIEIDGKKLAVTAGSMIIEAADKANIYIPRFCYHKKLSVAANCRMCLVEVEKARKPLPACATPVTEGMKVFTSTKIAREAQRAVMEFLLINHPLDCPVCDQGGECELQDLAMGYGRDVSRFTEGKRAVCEKELGPLIGTDMTRCIHCTRCVRFGQEIAGEHEIGAIGRGEDVEIMPCVEKTINSELSGNMVDVCPVGALNSKPFRFRARTWELKQAKTISPHDCVGSNLYAHVRRNNEVMRVVPCENEAINEVWLADRDRFSYEGLYHADRLQTPMIKIDDIWHEVTWEEALQETTKQLQTVLNQAGAKAMGALASPSSTTEEFFLLQKLMRGVGVSDIDYRLRRGDFRDDKALPANLKADWCLEEIPAQNTLLLIGSNIRKDQPILGHRVRQCFVEGGDIFALNSIDYPFHFSLKNKIITAPTNWIGELKAIAKALASEQCPDEMADLLKEVTPTQAQQAFAEQLKKGENKTIIVGLQAYYHPQGSLIRSLSRAIAHLLKAKYGELTPGSNSVGAEFAGCVPHREAGGIELTERGGNVQAMLAAKHKAYVLLNVEPQYDFLNTQAALTALSQASVIAMTPYVTDSIKAHATVLLPMCAFSETSGSYYNVSGQIQQFTACTKPLGQSRPAWKILRVLGNLLQVNGFEYNSSDEVFADFKSYLDEKSANESSWHYFNTLDNKTDDKALALLFDVPLYRTDSLVRRSECLQQTADNQLSPVQINDHTAKACQVSAGDVVHLKMGQESIAAEVGINNSIADNTLMVLGGGQLIFNPTATVQLTKATG